MTWTRGLVEDMENLSENFLKTVEDMENTEKVSALTSLIALAQGGFSVGLVFSVSKDSRNSISSCHR